MKAMAEETDQQRIETKKANAPVERRAAVNFWIMLGRPEEYVERVGDWTKKRGEALRYMEMTELEEFKKFLHWALEENKYSAEYLRQANDPAATLVKNLESLRKRYLAYLKGKEMGERKTKKLKDSNLPAYRQESGKREILKGDL